MPRKANGVTKCIGKVYGVIINTRAEYHWESLTILIVLYILCREVLQIEMVQ